MSKNRNQNLEYGRRGFLKRSAAGVAAASELFMRSISVSTAFLKSDALHHHYWCRFCPRAPKYW
ncbi:MAG: twin-arginine translocation signal domain-containing protein [Paludibacteraceae bacterium]|nr:twin-arginine translocation signal domain-containing protein [Paludibacteraceae bacterium]